MPEMKVTCDCTLCQFDIPDDGNRPYRLQVASSEGVPGIVFDVEDIRPRPALTEECNIFVRFDDGSFLPLLLDHGRRLLHADHLKAIVAFTIENMLYSFVMMGMQPSWVALSPRLYVALNLQSTVIDPEAGPVVLPQELTAYPSSICGIEIRMMLSDGEKDSIMG